MQLGGQVGADYVLDADAGGFGFALLWGEVLVEGPSGKGNGGLGKAGNKLDEGEGTRKIPREAAP